MFLVAYCTNYGDLHTRMDLVFDLHGWIFLVFTFFCLLDLTHSVEGT